MEHIILENIKYFILYYMMFSCGAFIKGFIWLKYHLHYNVKKRGTTTETRVREVFKWDFIRPFKIISIIMLLLALIPVEQAYMFSFVLMMYIVFFKEFFTIFGLTIGEWDTKIPYYSFFRVRKLIVIENY